MSLLKSLIVWLLIVGAFLALGILYDEDPLRPPHGLDGVVSSGALGIGAASSLVTGPRIVSGGPQKPDFPACRTGPVGIVLRPYHPGCLSSVLDRLLAPEAQPCGGISSVSRRARLDFIRALSACILDCAQHFRFAHSVAFTT